MKVENVINKIKLFERIKTRKDRGCKYLFKLGLYFIINK